MMKNASGFSLIEILVTVAILASVTLMATKFLDDQKANTDFVVTQSEIDKKMSEIESLMADPAKCKSMFRSKEINQTFSALNFTTPAGAVVPILRSNEKTSDHFFIKDGGIQLLPSDLGPPLVKLSITYWVPERSLFLSGKTIKVTKDINFLASLDESLRIKACGSVVADANEESMKKMCESLGAGGGTQWKDDRCLLTKSFACPYGKVPDELTAFGVLKCVDAETKVLVTDIFNFDSIGNCDKFELLNRDGKVALACDGPKICHPRTKDNCMLTTTFDKGTSGTCATGFTGSCSYTCNLSSWGSPSLNTCAPASP